MFLDGNALGTRWRQPGDRDTFVIGETGFGTGLNFLAAWRLWSDTAPAGADLHYLAVERFPLDREALGRALSAWPPLEREAAALLAAWPECPHRGLHRLRFDGGRIGLTLALDEAVPGLEAFLESTHPLHRLPRRGVDAWFLDGFAPARNPDMWRPALLELVRDLSRDEATFATFTAAGEVRRGLEAAGFAVEKAPGFGRKREMLRGRLARPAAPPDPAQFAASPYPDGLEQAWHVDPNPRIHRRLAHITVVGGGLAGCHAARALAERGLEVTLLEAEATLASGGSGNDQGVLYGRLSAHDSAAALFNLSALAFAQRHYAPWWADPSRRFGEACGVLHLAPAGDEAMDAFHALAARHGAQSLFRILQRDEASKITGVDLPAGGLWFPGSGWLAPPALCQDLVDHARITVRQERATQIEAILDETDAVILACAGALGAFEATSALPVQPVRGQVSQLPLASAPAAADLRVALCGEGYIAPGANGAFSFGASFKPGDVDTSTRTDEHEANLSRLRRQVPGLVNEAINAEACTGRAALRCATRDRLPLVGPVPDTGVMKERFALLGKNANAAIPDTGAFIRGLYVSAGYGSRGLAYIPLCTELLLADLLGTPPPVDRDLRRALSPARFLVRDLARGQGSAQ